MQIDKYVPGLVFTRQDGTLHAPNDDEDHNDEDEVDMENAGVVAKDEENAGVAAKEDLNEEEVFVDVVDDVLVDEGDTHDKKLGLSEIADEKILEKDDVVLDAVHVDVVDEVEATKPPNTNDNTVETVTDDEAPKKSKFGRPLRRLRFRDPAEGYEFSTIRDNDNTTTKTKYVFAAKAIEKEESEPKSVQEFICAQTTFVNTLTTHAEINNAVQHAVEHLILTQVGIKKGIKL